MFKLAFRNLMKNKARTILSIAGVAVCVFIFAGIFALDIGLKRMIDETGGKEVLIVFQKFKACPPYSRIPLGYLNKIKDLAHVEEVMPVKFLMSNCGTTTDLVVIHGVDKEKLRKIRDLEFEDPAAYNAFRQEKSAAIVGRSTAVKFGWKAGQQVSLPKLRNISFTVRGIFESPGSSLEEVILVDREYLEQSISDIGTVTMFVVLVDSSESMNAVSAAIDSMFENSHTQTRTTPERGFISDQVKSFTSLVQFSQLVAYISLILLLAAVANSISMSVRDRLKEVALIKLIGYTSTGVCIILMIEAAFIGMVASAAGASAAWLVLSTSNLSISVEGFTLYPQITPEILGTAFYVGLALSLIGAWMAAYSASQRPITEALRSVE